MLSINTSIVSIEPFDWINRFFGSDNWPFRGARRNFGNPFGSYDEIRREMEMEFEESFRNIEKMVPKELIKEYDTAQGKVREIGPLGYGSSVTIGPDGKPKIKEFGNFKPSQLRGSGYFGSPMIRSEREPMSDVTETDKEVKVVVEMPGVSKENIKINAYENKVEVKTEATKRRYHEVIEIPVYADIETAKSNYNNGILEIIFKKKAEGKPKGKNITVD
jgi:HSP20 family protein